MKVVRTAALSRHAAPQFAALTDEEVIALRLLPAWVRWLYLELVAMSDFKTGLIYTSYARLASLLDCDQPVNGGKRLDVPTIKQIRTALDTLATMNLALRDRAGNEEKRELKILVAPRVGLSAPKAEKGRGKGRPQNGYNYDEHGPSRKPDTQLGQRSGQGVQDPNSLLPLPLQVDKLSTHEGSGNASLQGPQGGQEGAPGAHAPQGSHQAPPGGPTPAPAGRAPRWTDAPRSSAPETWQRDAQGRLVPPEDHGYHAHMRYRALMTRRGDP